VRIAFLGLGRMGRILARHVLDDGHDLRVWNRTAGAAEELGAAGATVAGSAAEAVDGAEVVITALFGPDAVRAVVAEGSLPFGPDAVWLDITTIGPADARSMAEWAASASVRYVHSPVIGSLAPARNRALGVAVGGEESAVDEVLPLVRLWADPERLQRYADPGKAATGKLVANLALAVGMQGLVEAVSLGSAGGLSAEETLTTLKGTALGTIAGMKGANVLAGRFDDTQFSADLLAKDARLMVGTAPHPLPALETALAALQRAQDAGLGDQDFSVIATEAR